MPVTHCRLLFVKCRLANKLPAVSGLVDGDEIVQQIREVSSELVLHISAAGFHSLRARRSFTGGEVVCSFSARQDVAHPTYFSLQVDDDRHIELFPEYLQYLNHSCAPSVFLDVVRGLIIALGAIAEGDEITFFYPATEWRMTQAFECQCRTNECLGVIRGAATLPKDVLARYTLAPHVQRKLAARNAVSKS
ncbi:MAG: SET domain-containing protein [Gammaproteobacteria bacterium]|nr:SET domain-containing protein [Gammaproteobacteria bacterium]